MARKICSAARARTIWCGQVIAPKAKVRSAFPRKTGSRPVRAADDQRAGRCAGVAPAADFSCEILARQRGAAFVEANFTGLCGKKALDRRRLLGLAVFGTAGAQFVDLAHFKTGQADVSPRRHATLGVAGHKFALGAGFEPAHADQHELHPAKITRRPAFRRADRHSTFFRDCRTAALPGGTGGR